MAKARKTRTSGTAKTPASRRKGGGFEGLEKFITGDQEQIMLSGMIWLTQVAYQQVATLKLAVRAHRKSEALPQLLTQAQTYHMDLWRLAESADLGEKSVPAVFGSFLDRAAECNPCPEKELAGNSFLNPAGPVRGLVGPGNFMATSSRAVPPIYASVVPSIVGPYDPRAVAAAIRTLLGLLEDIINSVSSGAARTELLALLARLRAAWQAFIGSPTNANFRAFRQLLTQLLGRLRALGVNIQRLAPFIQRLATALGIAGESGAGGAVAGGGATAGAVLVEALIIIVLMLLAAYAGYKIGECIWTREVGESGQTYQEWWGEVFGEWLSELQSAIDGGCDDIVDEVLAARRAWLDAANDADRIKAGIRYSQALNAYAANCLESPQAKQTYRDRARRILEEVLGLLGN